MKAIFKILVILVVAVMIGGLLYGVVTASSSSTSQSVQFSNEPFSGQLPPNGDLNRPTRDGETDGFQFPVDSVKNLAIISVVGAIYLNTIKFLRKRKSALA